jgi:uncharacterized membrane protein HdeD (DUF308 family)
LESKNTFYKALNRCISIHSGMSASTKEAGWVRWFEIILGIIVVILSIYALAYPAVTFVAIVFLLGIILLIIGIEKVITGIFLHIRNRGATIGLGILVLIFAGLVLAYPVGTAWIFVIFIGIALLFAGGASIAQGFSGKESGWKRAFLIGVGALLIIIGIITIASPLFGAAFAGFVIAIGLLIAGIEMITAGATGRRLNIPSADTLTGKK